MPFKDPEEIWEEVVWVLDEEGLTLAEPQKSEVRRLFDQIWPEYKESK